MVFVHSSLVKSPAAMRAAAISAGLTNGTDVASWKCSRGTSVSICRADGTATFFTTVMAVGSFSSAALCSADGTAVVRLGGPHAEAEVEVAGLLAMSISWSSVLGGFGDLASTAAIFPT